MNPEHRIFECPESEFENEVGYRRTFGWQYVRQQLVRTATRSYHEGGAMSTGSGFLAAGVSHHRSKHILRIEMQRDRDDSRHDAYVEAERQCDLALSRMMAPARFGWILVGAAVVHYLLLGILTVAIPDAMLWWFNSFGRAAQEGQLVGVLPYLPLFVPPVLAAILIFRHMERKRLRNNADCSGILQRTVANLNRRTSTS